ncbi:hypothetical protein ACIBSV_14825 [Embleya sp. NPDC050154]|uniref:hypothetical protein n=1 Tax=Embleya sp. NPDC050154 TaxID=3363988 RepID=UPI0037A3C040
MSELPPAAPRSTTPLLPVPPTPDPEREPPTHAPYDPRPSSARSAEADRNAFAGSASTSGGTGLAARAQAAGTS